MITIAAVLGVLGILVMFFLGVHLHSPALTGRTIYAVYGKPNLPGQVTPVQCMGDEMICSCGVRFIAPQGNLAGKVIELETA